MMKLRLSLLALSLALFASYPALAQAPAGATGQCKDGSYWTGATKSGACRGHKGIQTWYAAAAPSGKSAKAAAPAPAPAPKPSPVVPTKPATPAYTPAPAPAPRSMPKPAATAAPGGGPGMVWVNTSTKVYHCQGDRYYGTTKDGKYMTEAQAKAMGAHGNRGKGCGQ